MVVVKVCNIQGREMADQMVFTGMSQDVQVRLQVGCVEFRSGNVGGYVVRRRTVQGNRITPVEERWF